MMLDDLDESQALTVSRYVSITDDVLQRLGSAVVMGEISELYPRSHLYFKLKDENSSVDCLMWGSQVRALPFRPELGMQVIAAGTSSLYKKNGQFKFMVRTMRPAGQGQILARLEKLKAQLAAEGLFSKPKRQVPRFVDVVGVITSPEGRVLHDICTTIQRRNPLIEVKLYPAAVQGSEAPASLCAALKQAYAEAACDVLIIGRGGGSAEDLLPFSDEQVVRTTAESPVPIISAVGHEPDTALTDFAADVRAATPTAAAELVTSLTAADIFAAFSDLVQRLDNVTALHLDEAAAQLDKLRLKLETAGPLQLLAQQSGMAAALEQRLQRAVDQALQQRRTQFADLQQKLLQVDLSAQLGRMGTQLGQMQQRLEHLTYQHLQQAEAQLVTLHKALARQPVLERLTAADKELDHAAGRLISLNPLAILQRGYSVTLNEQGQALKAGQAQPGSVITTLLQGERLTSTVNSVQKQELP